MKIKPDSMNLTLKEKYLINKAIDNNEFSIFYSPTLNKFENDLASYFSKEDATVLPNCTTAIQVALIDANIDKNKYIILPNLTHASVVYAVTNLGYKIVLCDFKENSYDINLDVLDKNILKHCGGFVISYLHGYPLNLKEVLEFCSKHNLVVIEDLAQGMGVNCNGILTGTKSDYACLSFGECKTLRLGEGGALVHSARSKNNINKIRHVGEIYKSNNISAVGNDVTYDEFVNDGLSYEGKGFNYRVVAYAYAFGSYRLKKLDKFIFNRQQKLQLYIDCLKNSNINYISNLNCGVSNVAPISMWCLIKDETYLKNLMFYLIQNGVPVGKFKYTTINEVEYFKQFIVNDGDFPNSKYVREHSMFLPLYENISKKDIIQICKLVNGFNNDVSLLNSDKQVEYFDGFFIK